MYKSFTKNNWDLSKAVLKSTTSVTWYLIYWVAVSDDGTKLYYQTNNWNRVTATLHQFTLTTPFDLSTKTSEVTLNFGSSSAAYWVYPWNITFRNNWQYLYIGYNNSGAPMYMERYTLSTPRDISTATLTNQIAQTWTDGWTIFLSEDGTKERYAAWDGTYYKSLTTAYEPELWTKVTNTNYKFMRLSSDGNNLYSDWGSTITQYSLSTPRDITTASQENVLTKPASWNYWEWIYFNQDGSKLWTLRWWVNSTNIYYYEIE